MQLVWGVACAWAVAVAVGCGGSSVAPEPPGPGGSLDRSIPPPPGGSPGAAAEPTCAERSYGLPVGPQLDGPVPCSGGFCIESAPVGMTSAFIAGERGALWAFGDWPAWYVRSFLRQQGDRWISTCPPPGAWTVTAVHGARGDDVWIGGLDGYLAHWDGVAWIRTPSPATGTVRELWGDGREAFASVQADTGARPADDGLLLRWDGAMWRDTGATGRRPWGDAAGRAWAVSGDAVVEWNGAAWNALHLPADFAARDVWAPPGGGPWILGHRLLVPRPPPGPGSYGFTAVVLRRDAERFVDVQLPSSEGARATWIRGASATDVRVATGPRYMRDLSHEFRWDGTRWSTRAGNDSPVLPPHVLATGEALVWDGTLRTVEGDPVEPTIQVGHLALNRAATSGAGDVWLGGSGLWRLDGGAFRIVSDDTSPVIAIDARAPDDVWAQTGAGDFLHWNGATTEHIDRPWLGSTLPSMSGVASAGGGRAWSIGGEWDGQLRNCSLWRWDGAWSTVPMPVPSCPGRITSGPQGDLWLAAGGDVWRRDVDGAFSRYELPAREIGILVARSRSDVWAAGDGIYRFDGTGWRSVGDMLVHALSVASADDVWAVASEDPTGRRGVWHWDGRAWTRWHTEIVPFDLAAVGGGEVWGAAGGSVVHRRVPPVP